MASNNIARLGVILGLDSAEFVRGLDTANKKLYDFSVKAAGIAKDALLAAGAAFAAATYSAMQFADAIADVAKANDVSIASILKLNNALANAGGEANNAGKLLASFTGYIDKAAEGSFEAQKSLKLAGVSLQDLANMGMEDLFAKAVQGIAAIEDPLTRNAKAMEMFGKAAKGVDFVGLAEEMRKTSNATDEQAIAIQAAADAYDLITQQSRNFQLSFTSEIGPSLLLATEYFLDLGNEINKTGGLWKSVFDTVAYQAASLVHEIKDLISVFIAWDAVLDAFFEARWGEIDGIVSRRYAERTSEEAKLEAFRQKLEGIGSGIKENERGSWEDGPKKKPAAGGPKRGVKEGVEAEAERARKEAERDAERARKEAAQDYKRMAAEYVKGIDEMIAREKALADIDIKNAENYKAAVKLMEQQRIDFIEERVAAEEAAAIAVAAFDSKRAEDYKAAMKEMAQQQADYYVQKVAANEADAVALASLNISRAEARKQLTAQQALQAQDLERAHELFILEANAAQLLPEKLAMERDYLQIRNRHFDAVKAISENRALDDAARIEALATEESLMKRQLELVTERYRVNKEITDQQKTFSAGWKRAFDSYVKDADDAGRQGEKSFQIFTDNVGRSIDELVDKGETSFERLTQAILNDMTKIYLKQQMMKAVGELPGIGAGIGGFFSSMFGGGVSLGGATGGAAAMPGGYGFGMHATGGNVAANSPSWVGERGPEMFIPNQSGMIVPNNALGDTMGSQPSNVYNGPYIASMSAIDTQSGLQFLAKNKQGVWAANQSANRSIPMSR
jgi:lambda family phage tail tape measure protein